MMDGMIEATGRLRFGRDFRGAPAHQDASGEGWDLLLGDSAERLREIEPESCGMALFSPPFPGMYLYSNTEHDVGNARNLDELVEHMAHICGAPLLDALMPGRTACLHLMQMPAYRTRDDYAGIIDFRGATIKMMIDLGWHYAGEATIDKDPQIQAVRHKEHGLLFKTLATDAAAMRMGLADYLLYFRKPGENPAPIRAGIHPVYQPAGEGWITQEEWIRWAHPVWYQIRESDTLNPAIGRDNDDERHLCPLQHEVVRRAVLLKSNPGEIVLSPFAGIGSEGVGALRQGRRFLGVELKESYWRAAQRNLRAEADQLVLGAAV